MDSTTENREPSPRRTLLWNAAKTLISTGLLAWLIWTINWSEMVSALRDFSWPLMLLSVALFTANHFLTAARLRVLLRAQAIDITYGYAVRLTFSGLYANNFLPSTVGGDVVKYAILAQRGISKAESAASLIMDRVVNLAAIIALTPLSYLLINEMMPRWQTSYLLIMLVAGVAGTAALIALYRYQHRLINWLEAAHSEHKWLTRATSALARILRILSNWMTRPGTLMAGFLYSLGSIAFTVGSLWILAVGSGSPVTYLQTAAIAILVYFATLLPISFNGLGLQEVSFTLLFAQFSTPEPTALTIAILYRLVLILTSLPGGVLSMVRTRPDAGRK